MGGHPDYGPTNVAALKYIDRMVPSMLLFYPAPSGLDVEAVSRFGLSSREEERLSLYTSLDAAKKVASGRVLVVDWNELDSGRQTSKGGQVSHVPSTAIKNLSPYRPPKAVTAAGGYVACALRDDVAVLLIYRRGVWDIPKGTLDPGEDIASCARREVCEEVGITNVHLLGDLGTTQHGYVDRDLYKVKTTYWYLMRTPERSFTPERQEGIRRVSCARWIVARQHVGYETLQRHMDRVESDVRRAFS